MSECYKCKKEMTMTPVCGHCGIIPIAEASFTKMDNTIKALEAKLAEANEAWQIRNNEACKLESENAQRKEKLGVATKLLMREKTKERGEG